MRCCVQGLCAAIAVIFSGAVSMVYAADAGQPKQNILLVFADQLHGFALGCMGNTQIHTPNLDRLAGEGVLFTDNYSNNPLCAPYRAILMTGRYASQNGVQKNPKPKGDKGVQGQRTVADCLNEQGYRTSYVGKWHLGGHGNVAVPKELRGGFMDFIGYQCFNDFLNDVWFFDEAGKKAEYKKHRTDATTDIAIERLEKLGKAGNQPFALFVSYQNPHYPLQPSPEFEALYKDIKITRRPNSVDVDPYTSTDSPYHGKTDDPSYIKYHNNLDEYLRLYYAMVTQLDADVGRLLKRLDELGLSNNTAVIFTSDHGDMAGSHGLTNKRYSYEESVRTPLIARVPGGVKGKRITVPVSAIDLLPTCLGLAGAPPLPGSEGVDLAPSLRSETQPARRPVFSEQNKWIMVRDGDYKLVVQRGGQTPLELFNLKDDPYEMKNLVNNKAHTEITERLQKLTIAWLQHVRPN